jgi:hypothetical protein
MSEDICILITTGISIAVESNSDPDNFLPDLDSDSKTNILTRQFSEEYGSSHCIHMHSEARKTEKICHRKNILFCSLSTV